MSSMATALRALASERQQLSPHSSNSMLVPGNLMIALGAYLSYEGYFA